MMGNTNSRKGGKATPKPANKPQDMPGMGMKVVNKEAEHNLYGKPSQGNLMGHIRKHDFNIARGGGGNVTYRRVVEYRVRDARGKKVHQYMGTRTQKEALEATSSKGETSVRVAGSQIPVRGIIPGQSDLRIGP